MQILYYELKGFFFFVFFLILDICALSRTQKPTLNFSSPMESRFSILELKVTR